ncbi:hypothetical protein BDA99DRAFT_88964 [Phascolomyces articulosus]|uniref:Uncharacterized protein n=1 Tax=Phascolomyces articulosus TaxID=60185 RepID=A0AAD5K906_9FUNG|nr:hypothetical protein BDA99DRAFT_88964 [Phascolomyces articulosus]
MWEAQCMFYQEPLQCSYLYSKPVISTFISVMKYLQVVPWSSDLPQSSYDVYCCTIYYYYFVCNSLFLFFHFITPRISHPTELVINTIGTSKKNNCPLYGSVHRNKINVFLFYLSITTINNNTIKKI